MWKYEAQKHVRGARQHVYRRLATWQQKSLQCGRILQGFQRFGTQLGNMFQTEPFPSVSGPIQLHGIRTLPLFNFWQSLFRHQARWQICHYSTSTGLTSFAVLNDSSTSVSQIHWGVQSVSDLAPDPLLHLEKKSTSVKKNMKSTLSSPEIHSIGCLFKLKRTYVYVQYHGPAGSGVMSL